MHYMETHNFEIIKLKIICLCWGKKNIPI